MGYAEAPAGVPGVTVWRRSPRESACSTVILPDGCLDILWNGSRLAVAGPDRTARRHWTPGGTGYFAVRLAGGTGPAVLGVPAAEMTDLSIDLSDLLGPRAARSLAADVEREPVSALSGWVRARLDDNPVDPSGPALLALAEAGASAAQMAARLCVSSRQLHRRCRSLFGYGPRRLIGVLRFNRAYELAASGTPLTEVANICGYADQAHFTKEARSLAGVPPLALLRESGAR